MRSNLVLRAWLAELKQKVRNAQLKAAVKVNSEMLSFYWELGADMVLKQAKSKWGEGFLSQLSKDLMSEFPEMKGFSERNLKYIRQWFLFYSKDQVIGQQAVAQLSKQSVLPLADKAIAQEGVLARLTQIPHGAITSPLSPKARLSRRHCSMSTTRLSITGAGMFWFIR